MGKNPRWIISLFLLMVLYIVLIIWQQTVALLYTKKNIKQQPKHVKKPYD